MKARGGGAIVMITSIWGREAGGRMTYNAVKAAEISLAKAMAQQLAPSNIRVNSVAPGSILFPGGSWHRRQQTDPDGIADMIRRDLPFGRFGRPEEVANGGRVSRLAARVAGSPAPPSSWTAARGARISDRGSAPPAPPAPSLAGRAPLRSGERACGAVHDVVGPAPRSGELVRGSRMIPRCS